MGSKLVDIVWHEHIIDTKQYMIDCDRLFGRYLHHYPDFGQVGAFLYEEDMLKAYMEEFGELPREDIWPLDQAANATTFRRLGACGYRPPPTRRRWTPYPTYPPTPRPTYRPTPTPTYAPTPRPTHAPTPAPTYAPTPTPTYAPTPTPTHAPTPRPTYAPTPRPTHAPTPAPYAPTPTPTYPPRRRTPTPTYPPRLRTPAPTHQPPSIYGDLTKPKRKRGKKGIKEKGTRGSKAKRVKSKNRGSKAKRNRKGRRKTKRRRSAWPLH